MSETYQSNQESNPTHGHDYQKHLALALFLRMRDLQNDKNLQEETTTKIAYEMKDADKFDDVVLLDGGGETIHFIQAKHGNAKDDEIVYFGLDALFPKEDKKKRNGDFSLFKYLDSYVRVTHRFALDSAKFAPYKKKSYYLFTNRELKVSSENEWVETKLREVNEILRFPRPNLTSSKKTEVNSRHLELSPTDKACNELETYINSDITKLVAAIKQLFDDGKVTQILIDYSIPLSEVLTIDENMKCKFLSSFDSKNLNYSVAKLYKLLEKSIDSKKVVEYNFLPPKPTSLPSFEGELNDIATMLIKAIKQLFNDGTVSPILINYNIPLSAVFTIDANLMCSISKIEGLLNKNSNVANLNNLLKDSIDYKTAHVKAEYNFLTTKKIDILPPYVTKNEIVDFFRDFTLSVAQPNDLQPIVACELKTWMKTWMWPEALGLLGKKELAQEVTELETHFDKCNNANEKNTRYLIEKCNIDKYLATIEKEFKKKTKYPSSLEVEEMENQYTNRDITLIENYTEQPANQINRTISDTKFVEELRGSYKDKQNFVLVADPGMGKTRLLQYLAFEVQKKKYADPGMGKTRLCYVDVFFIYLNTLVDELKEVSKTNQPMAESADSKEVLETNQPMAESADNKEVSETNQPMAESADNKEVSETNQPMAESVDNKEVSETNQPMAESADNKEVSETNQPMAESADNKEVSETNQPMAESADNKEVSETNQPMAESADNKEVSELSKEDVLKILSSALSEDNCNIIKNALEMKDSDGYPILMVFDAFDEIHPPYTNIVIQMLKILSSEKRIQIIIGTRKHAQEDLEKNFELMLMQIEPFNDKDQTKYLGKIWDVSKDDEERLQKFTEPLLDQFQSSDSYILKISCLPMMLRLLAEIYSEDFKEFKTGKKIDFSKVKLNKLQIYEKFVINCFHKKFIEKYQPAIGFKDRHELNAVIEGFVVEHQLFAIKQLKYDKIKDLFKNPRYKEKFKRFIERCVEKSEKSILVKVYNKKVHFHHLSYGEYFVSKYLCDNIFALSKELIISILSDSEVVRDLSLIEMEENKAYYELLYALYDTELMIVVWACEYGCQKMVSSWKDNLKLFSIHVIDMMIGAADSNGHNELKDFLTGCKKSIDTNITSYSAANSVHKETYSGEMWTWRHGDDFQIDLALTLFLRMRNYGFPIRMAYEMREADKYDDVVLFDDKRGEIHFIKVKHSSVSDGKVKPIDRKMLFPTTEFRSNYNLFEYLKSYVTVTNRFKQSRFAKKFYVFTNTDLKFSENEWLTSIEKREVNEILSFPGPSTRHLKLNPTGKAIEKMQNYINKDLIELKNAIKDLFVSGKVNNILTSYSIPLREVLTIDKNNMCKFSRDFNMENTTFSVSKLHNLLNGSIYSNRKVKVEANFLQKRSRAECLPPYVTEDEVVAFFDNFTLSVGIPSDLRPIVDNESKAWMKEWMQQDVFDQLSKTWLPLTFSNLKNYFDECNKPLMNKEKRFLDKSHIEKCLKQIQCKLNETITNLQFKENSRVSESLEIPGLSKRQRFQ